MKIGLDKIAANASILDNCGRIGFITHQAVTDSSFMPAALVIEKACEKLSNTKLVALFSPQHGYGQTEQDNMFETPDDEFVFSSGKHIPLFSLYSKTRIPLPEQMAIIDTLVIDMPDIGCRVYTYIQTLANCLEAAALYKKKVIVLDRPNPIGLSHFQGKEWRNVEGNCLDLKYASFVGGCPIPLRHGLTMGEFGKYYIGYKKLDVDYDVVTVEGLARNTSLQTLSRQPFVLPSPNMPSWDSALWFVAFVVLEATNVSEGRGTTLPFQIIGAPWLAVDKLSSFLLSKNIANQEDFYMRPHNFRPTFNKFSGQICKGMQFHSLNAENLKPFDIGMWFLAFCAGMHANNFEFKAPGYEYNFDLSPYLLILGDARWENAFGEIQRHGLTKSTEKCMTETIAWASGNAQEFADKSRWAHLYQ